MKLNFAKINHSASKEKRKRHSKISKDNSTILLLDSPFNLDEVKRLISKDGIKIITFDYDSHSTLLKNKILHEISDKYITKEDLLEIQKNSYNYLNWSKDPSIENLLEYEGVNLGELFSLEFHYMLVPYLKKFLEISKIVEANPKTKFVCSFMLHNITKSLTNSELINKEKIISNKFLFDSIKLHFKLGKNTFSIRLPRSSYIKVKNISELIIHKLFGPKNRFSSNQKSFLMIEFDTIKFQSIFSISKNFPLNLILFDRRRPSIWNLNSFSIIKKSNVALATSYDAKNKKLQNSTNNGILETKLKIKQLWLKNNFFQSFFSISGITFWDSLKPIFIELCEKRILEAIKEIEITKSIFEKYSPTSILIWSESAFNEKIAIQIAKKLGIQIILLQHGLYNDTPKSFEFNDFVGVLPLKSDKIITWGNEFKKYLINCGFLSKKIVAMGSPVHDKYFKKKKNGLNLKEDYILLATSSPTQSLVNDLTIETQENYLSAIKKICQIVSQMNKKLVIKLHPFQEELDITETIKKIDPNIIIIKNEDILTLIESCEILIVTDISTTILEGQIYDKPVISVSIKDHGFGDSGVFTSNSCIKTDMENFESSLSSILNNKNFKNELIKNGTNYINEYLSNQGNASQNLLSFLKNNK